MECQVSLQQIRRNVQANSQGKLRLSVPNLPIILSSSDIRPKTISLRGDSTNADTYFATFFLRSPIKVSAELMEVMKGISAGSHGRDAVWRVPSSPHSLKNCRVWPACAADLQQASGIFAGTTQVVGRQAVYGYGCLVSVLTSFFQARTEEDKQWQCYARDQQAQK